MAKFTKGTIIGIIGGVGVAAAAVLTAVFKDKAKDEEVDAIDADCEEVEVEAVEDEAE